MALTAAQKQQLVQVYDEAVAAGDKAAQARVRDVLARDRAEVPKAPQQFATAEQAEFENYGVSNAEQRAANAEGFSALGEGVRRAGAGVKQVAAGVSDYFTRADKAGRGLKDKVTAQELLRQKMDQLATQERGDSVPFREGVAAVGESLPLALVPEAALPRATTLGGGVLKSVATGGLGGLGTFDKDGGNVGNAVTGATVSGLVGGTLAVAPALKNQIAKALNESTAGSRTAKALQNAQTVMPDMPVSLSQRTGIPELKTLERASYNSDLTKFYADQTDKFVEDFVKVMDQKVPAGADLDSTYLATQKRAKDLLDSAKMNSSNAYETGMSKAATMNVPAPGSMTQVQPVQIPSTDYTGQLDMMAKRAADPTEGISSELASKIEAWSQQAKKGFLTPQELAAHLRGLTRTIKGGGEDGALAGRMKDALERDLDRLPQNGTLKANDVAQQIIETRAEYKRARAAIEVMADSAAYKMLGVADPTAATSDTLLSRFNSFTPEKQRQVQKYLSAESPELLAQMKQAYVNGAVKASGSLDAAADSRKSLDQLADNLFDEKRGFDLRSSGLWDADELKKVEAFKDGLRVIRNNRPTVGGAGTPIKPEDIVINLVSRSGEFASRQLTRILMSTKGSQVFTDPAVYEAMTKMNRATTGSAADLTARTMLLTALQDNYSEGE